MSAHFSQNAEALFGLQMASESQLVEPSTEGNVSLMSSSVLGGVLPQSSSSLTNVSKDVNFLTVQKQNGQIVIQQPLMKTTNGPVTVVGNGPGYTKVPIVVRQKSFTGQSSGSSATPVEKVGVKRPLVTSGGNVITKVIITKNPISGQLQPVTVESVSGQTLLPATSNLTNSQVSSVSNQPQTVSVIQPGALTKSSEYTPGLVSPVKTVITTLPGAGSAKNNLPKVPISPTKSPTKIKMIPMSKSPIKPSNNSNITVLTKALNSLAQSGNVTLKPGSPSKVIIKQGPAPTGASSITLKAQPISGSQAGHAIKAPHLIQSLRPQNGQQIRQSNVSNTSSVQQIQVPGSKFHYVRLVSPSNQSQATTVTVARPLSNSQPIQASKTVTLTTTTSSTGPGQTNQVKITLPVQQPTLANTLLAPKPAIVPVSSSNQATSIQRTILPATSIANAASSLTPIQPAPPATPIQSLSQLPPGTAILSGTGANVQCLQGFALVPASYVTQFQQMNKSLVSQSLTTTVPQTTAKQSRDYIPIASIDPAVTQYTVSRNTPSQNGPTLEATGTRPRKPCNCTKSQCLKLYCDCFANGEFCQNCNCTNCANNLEREEERSKAIKSCLDRNPQAFHPKIGKGKEVEGLRRHNKGCNCKRSGCLKNYCECYEAKIMCSNFCKCVGCKNFEESPERKTLMHLADAAEVRVQQQTAAKTKISSQISCVPSKPPAALASGERLPFALITSDVAEATSACLLAQAEEAERMKMPPVVQERMIIEEFGRCLMQIIDSANRTRTASTMS